MPRINGQSFMQEQISQQWARHGLLDRVRMVITMLINFPGFMLFELLAKIPGLEGWSREGAPVGQLERVTDQCYRCVYMHAINMVVLRSSDRKRCLIISAAPISNALSEQVKALGTVEFIVITRFHDSFGWQWKEQFPSARVLGAKADVEHISQSVKVDAFMEDMPVRQQLESEYAIKDVVPTREFAYYTDWSFVVRLPNDKSSRPFVLPPNAEGQDPVMLVMACAFLSKMKWSPFNMIWGFWRDLGLPRMFSLMFCHSQPKAFQHWLHMAEHSGDVRIFFSLHGDPIDLRDSPEPNAVGARMRRDGIVANARCLCTPLGI